MRFASWMGLLSMLAPLAAARGATHHVPAEYVTIQGGVDAAVAGDTVLVAPGVYSEFEVRFGQFGLLSACLFLKDGVVVRSEGGALVTSIDRMGIATAEPSYTVYGTGALDAGVAVEGFRITGNPPSGVAITVAGFSGELLVRDCAVEDLPGGAFNIRYGKVLLKDTTVRTGGAQGFFGIGANVTVEGCLFDGNSPAIRCSGDDIVPPQHLTVRNSSFRNNAANEGAGIAVSDYFNGVLIEDCVFENNTAGSGGAVFAIGVGPKVIRGNLFVNNRAEGDSFARGGAMRVSQNVVTIEGNTIVDSFQEGPSGGAAINATVTAPGSVIRNNVIAGSTGNIAVRVANGTATTSCNVFWNNVEGDIVGVPLDPTDQVADPLFCDPPSENYYVSTASPCLPENNPNCVDLIGAFGAACGFVSIESMSWGRLKGIYRVGE